MITTSAAIAYNPGKIAALAAKFALAASINSANALPPRNVDLYSPIANTFSEARDIALADWIKSNPAKIDGLLEALVVSDIESPSANDTRPVDSQKLTNRFTADAMASHALVEHATSLIQQVYDFQPLAYSAETRDLARLAIDAQNSRVNEDIEEWASALVRSAQKQA
ncbi:hypothetical protein [Burkholderia cepacia]|uniref:hypothetical protein n=1 Tax=Burkholderia cepacia TaxID=292 RepID=UPI000F5B12EB|nr:hypothetical protein [Burkholderia cepacia]